VGLFQSTIRNGRRALSLFLSYFDFSLLPPSFFLKKQRLAFSLAAIIYDSRHSPELLGV